MILDSPEWETWAEEIAREFADARAALILEHDAIDRRLDELQFGDADE